MANYNSATLMGNLTRDPELRVTPKGTAVCGFSLAVNREYKTDSGEKKSETLFMECSAWGKTGEAIAKYCTKGKPLFVTGRLLQQNWEDKTDGKKRSKIVLVVDNFQFIGGKKDDEGGGSDRSAPASKPAPSGGDDSDEIPF